MYPLVYPREKILFTLNFIISTICWAIIFFGLFYEANLHFLAGFAPLLVFLYILSLFAQSALITHIRGNGILVTEKQFPDIYKQYNECCSKLKFEKNPELYILQSNGILNAFATRFVRNYYVVLYSDVVDALENDSSKLNFYLGHELGHIKRSHLNWDFYFIFTRAIPFLYAAYSRAREYSCDRHGLFCVENPKDAVLALSVLAAGKTRWKNIDIQSYISQTDETGYFWSAFHELRATYPRLCKRVAWLESLSQGEGATPIFPIRNFFAYLLAVVLPNLATIIIIYILSVEMIVKSVQNNKELISSQIELG